ncbi:iron-siderophore ABC transporter substrate-binding protein [Sporichthya brevicatena]|uniref:Iron-siderophore ABC transporter substrate-binding protein n=1 Tax=Sporichthya brevicatena TaxID=171442 RepID=A0ABP3RTM3_9ACTN
MRARTLVATPALLALLTLPLAACSDDENTLLDGPRGGVEAPAQSASPAAGTQTSGTRTVTHAKGSTEVPAAPQRIVTLDSPILDAAIFLGLKPVGAVRTSVDTGISEYLADRTEGVEIVGEIAKPNLEAIAALQPDLILSSTLRDDALYDKLSAIAPTVFANGPGTAWREDFLLVGEALNRGQEARDALADFDRRASELGDRLGLKDADATIMRFLPGETRVYGPDSFSGSVLRAVGLGAPDLAYDQFAIARLSSEELTRADADILFTTTYGAEDETTRGEVTPLWGRLQAVQKGCQFDVDDDTWMVGIGLIGATAILDDLEAKLSEGDCGRD